MEGDVHLPQPAFDLFDHALNEGVVLGALGFQRGFDLVVGHGVEVFEGRVLQLPLHALHAQAVGDGRVNLHGFQRLLALLVRGLVLHGAHVVGAVGNLDEDDADVPGHGHEHLAQILHLLLFLGGVDHAGELAHALHQIGDGGGKLPGHVLVGHVGVLDGVVQQGGDNGLGVQMQLVGHDLRHGDGMCDVGRAVLALLLAMMLHSIVIGFVDHGEVRAVVITLDGFDQMVVLLLYGQAASPPVVPPGLTTRLRFRRFR